MSLSLEHSRVLVTPAPRALALVISLLIVAASADLAPAAASSLAWSAPERVDRTAGLTEVTCPSAELCLLVDNRGRLITSHQPGGSNPSWSSPVRVGSSGLVAQPNALSCPTLNLCVGVDVNDGVVSSIDPTAGRRAWRRSVLTQAETLTGVSCVSARLCVAAHASGGGGAVLISRNPRGGRRAWSRPVAVDGLVLDGISCVPGLCLATDPLGSGVASTAPAADRHAWTAQFTVDRGIEPQSVFSGGSDSRSAATCASRRLCAEIDTYGNVVTSTRPAGGGRAWSRPLHIYPGALEAIACPSPRFCAAVGDHGYVVTSAAPASAANSWTAPTKIDSADLTGISCPSTSFCVAVDSKGYVILGHQ